MNRRFDIFMRSADDDILEEAQLGLPRRSGLFRIAGLAACLCIIVGAYYMTFGGMGAKNEECAVPDMLYNTESTTAAAATYNESMPETTADDTKQDIDSSPAKGSPARSLLPENAIVCGFTVSDEQKQIDFSVGDMYFTLTASENDVPAEAKYRNSLFSDIEDETITWYSENGDTEYILQLIEGDYDLLYSTAEEIAENLGIDIE